MLEAVKIEIVQRRGPFYFEMRGASDDLKKKPYMGFNQ
jgi:hypothetical protein